ncbi:MAG: GNAT family N-acetyltransferase [Halieaceae bacterium]|nr:GNAT family N-acetyltransferase [Halieaceae bacterium]
MNPTPIDGHRAKSGLRRTLSNVGKHLGFAYYDMEFSLTDLSRPKDMSDPSIDLHAELASENDMKAIVAALPESPRYRFDQAVEGGGECYVARYEGQVIGYGFANSRAIVLLGAELEPLPEGFAYGHNMYLFPEYRGQGLYTTFIRSFDQALFSRGNRYSSSLVDSKNSRVKATLKHISIHRVRMPIVCLPGLRPIVLGRGFRIVREAAGALEKERVQRSQSGLAKTQ